MLVVGTTTTTTNNNNNNNTTYTTTILLLLLLILIPIRVLKEEALRRVQGWHKPLISLIEATDINNITGHPAYDRDPSVPGESSSSSSSSSYSRVVFAGDSAHCMSPFKGQGANQALLDSIRYYYYYYHYFYFYYYYYITCYYYHYYY